MVFTKELEAVARRCSVRFRKFHRKTSVPKTLAQVFSCEICGIFKNKKLFLKSHAGGCFWRIQGSTFSLSLGFVILSLFHAETIKNEPIVPLNGNVYVSIFSSINNLAKVMTQLNLFSRMTFIMVRKVSPPHFPHISQYQNKFYIYYCLIQ